MESRTAAPIADAGLGAEQSRGHDRSTASRRADPLALQARRERDGRRRASLATRPPHRSAGCRQDLSERSLPAAARPQRSADRRPHALGIRTRERRPGDEDRDHRRGNRPAAPVFLAGRVHDARRIPEGPDRLHDGQGHRRARVPARPPDLEERVEAVRPRAVVARHTRRGHRRRKQQHARRRNTHLRRRAARVPRQLQGADDSHRRRRGPGRQLARARGCDRSGRRRRHGRDQHVARRARDRAIPRHRRAGTRSGGSRRRGLRRRGRQRLQRLRPRVDRLARLGAGRDHRRCRLDVAQRPGGRGRFVLLEWADTAVAASEAGGERARRLDLLGRARRLVRDALRDEHGGAACRRWGGIASPAPPDVDAGAGEIGTRADGGHRLDRRPESFRADHRTRGWRCHQPAKGRQPARLCGAGGALVRPRRLRPPPRHSRSISPMRAAARAPGQSRSLLSPLIRRPSSPSRRR